MFYRELRTLTGAIRAVAVKDNDLSDVIAVLEKQSCVRSVEHTYAQASVDVFTHFLTLRLEHASLMLELRVCPAYVYVCKTILCVDGDVYVLRWYDDIEKFEFPIPEHKETVHAFLKSIVDAT